MNGWSVELLGESFDLEDLPRWTGHGQVEVTEQDGRWFLHSVAFEHLDDSSDVRRAAEDLLSMISGLVRLTEPSHRRVTIGSVHQRNPDGSGVIVAAIGIAEGRSKARAIAVLKDGVLQPDPDLGILNAALSHALASEHAQRMLLFLGGPEITWNDLYRAYEVLKRACGSTLLLGAGVSMAAARRFTGTANSYSTLGLAARHGVERTEPPRRPMTFVEARELVTALAREWLRSQGVTM